MESKSLEKYFSDAKKLPLVMTFADVQSLVCTKGVTSPTKKSWWNLKNIIIMTISIIFTAAILVYSLSVNNSYRGRYTPESNYFVSILEVDSKEGGKQLAKSQLFDDQTIDLASNEITSTNEDQHSTEELHDIDFSFIDNSKNQSLEPAGLSEFFRNYTSEKLVPSKNKEAEQPMISSKSAINEIDGETKTITQSVDAANFKSLTLSNKFGNIKVESWDKPTVEVTAYFTLETKDYEDAEKGLKNFKMNLIPEGNNVTVTNNWANYNNCSENSNNASGNKGLFNFSNQNSFTTDQGEKIKYKKFKIEYTVILPKYFNVNLSNSYADIEMHTIEGVANIEIFQGNLFANDMKELTLNLKYGTAEVNDIVNGRVESFQSTFRLGNSAKLNLNAKYSTVQIGGVEDLNLEGFQSNLVSIDEVKNLEGKWKYGKLELQKDAENVKIATFQTPFTAQNIDHLTMDMKYGNLTAQAINYLELTESFQSNIRIISVGKIEGSLKYSPVEIDLLKNEMNLKMFNGNLKIENIGSSFTEIDLEAKYTDISLRFDSNAKYKLIAETKYSKLTMPDGFRNVRHVKKTNQGIENFSGTFNESVGKEASQVNLNCFDGKIKLE